MMEDGVCTYVCEVGHQGPVLTLLYETLDHVAVRNCLDRQASLEDTPRFVQGTEESQDSNLLAKTCDEGRIPGTIHRKHRETDKAWPH